MPCCSSSFREVTELRDRVKECVSSIGKGFLGVAVTAAALFSVCCDSPAALAESLTVAFPVSRAREVPEFVYLILLHQSLDFYFYSLVPLFFFFI